MVDIKLIILAGLVMAAACYYVAKDFAHALYWLHRCNVKVEAVYRGNENIKTERDTRPGMYTVMPIFSYEYDGINYTSQSQRELHLFERNKYYEGERYTIRIDSDNPRKCVQGSIVEPASYFIIGMIFMTWFFSGLLQG